MRIEPALFLFTALVACTDAGLYAVDGKGPSGPDRVEISGTNCAPLAVGDRFPVKVLFAAEGGAGVDATTKSAIQSAISKVIIARTAPYISFGMVTFHSVATGLQGKFVDGANSGILNALNQYGTNQEAGPFSLRAPLLLAGSLLSGDMQTSCRGQVARTRYVVVLLMTDADDSCNNEVYNAGIDGECAKLNAGGNIRDCTVCELTRVTQELKALGARYGAGEVVVQPIYVHSTPDILARYQAAAIGRAGGAELADADVANLEAVLQGTNFASLQSDLKLKRLIAFNRNAISRNGVIRVDSDGDGLADEDELNIGTDPLLVDTDADGLGDGVEVKQGLDPLTMNAVNNCNPTFDTDTDRLNDCEERVLGTDGCISDTDGDGLPDVVELLGGTNPLIPEDLADDDRDGMTNIAEILAHSDPRSADLAFQTERSYGYSIKDAPATEDNRACYNISAYNVTLVNTLPRTNEAGRFVPRGNNEIFLYFQVGRDNDPRGTGIGSLFGVSVQFTPPNKKKPKGPIVVTPDDFVLGS
jgi:hypothetical protein